MFQRIKRWWRSKRVVYIVVPPIPKYKFGVVLNGKESQHLALLLAGRWCPSIADCGRYQGEMCRMIQEREKAVQQYRAALARVETDVEFLRRHLYPGEQKQ